MSRVQIPIQKKEDIYTIIKSRFAYALNVFCGFVMTWSMVVWDRKQNSTFEQDLITLKSSFCYPVESKTMFETLSYELTFKCDHTRL